MFTKELRLLKTIVRAKGETPLKPRTAGALRPLMLSVVDGWLGGDGMAKDKTRVVSFRVSEEVFAEYERKLKDSGVKKSQFLREVLFNSNATFQAPSRDYERLLFLYNKSSNNLNQLAYKVNSAYRKSGIISESLYIRAINELVLIRELLSAGVNHAD
nr:molybdopterin-guanine dinucleotide biosynthesis protein MobC [Pseudomonas fluorescens]